MKKIVNNLQKHLETAMIIALESALIGNGLNIVAYCLKMIDNDCYHVLIVVSHIIMTIAVIFLILLITLNHIGGRKMKKVTQNIVKAVSNYIETLTGQKMTAQEKEDLKRDNTVCVVLESADAIHSLNEYLDTGEILVDVFDCGDKQYVDINCFGECHHNFINQDIEIDDDKNKFWEVKNGKMVDRQ